MSYGKNWGWRGKKVIHYWRKAGNLNGQSRSGGRKIILDSELKESWCSAKETQRASGQLESLCHLERVQLLLKEQPGGSRVVSNFVWTNHVDVTKYNGGPHICKPRTEGPTGGKEIEDWACFSGGSSYQLFDFDCYLPTPNGSEPLKQPTSQGHGRAKEEVEEKAHCKPSLLQGWSLDQQLQWHLGAH